MPQRYQGSSKGSQCVSDKYSWREIFNSRSLWSFWGGRFKHGSMSKTPSWTWDFLATWKKMHSSASRGSQKGGPKEGRTHKRTKKLWKRGGYLFQSEQVTKQHVILHALDNFLRHADGRLGPVRSQLSTNADNVSSSTARYYKRGRENKYARFGVVEWMIAVVYLKVS